jgi:ribosomal protein S27AE
MPIHDTQNPAQYPQNPVGSGAGVGSVYFVDGLARVESLLAELQSVGVVLSVEGDRLAFDAPADVLTDDMLGRLRADRDGLLAVISRPDAAPVADPGPAVQTSSIRCPVCDGIDLAEDPGGLRCGSCGAVAWVATAEGGLARCDSADELLDPDLVPICRGCGRWCDVMTLAEAWRCSRCDPEAEDRRRRTWRVMGIVSRSRGRTVPSVRRGV